MGDEEELPVKGTLHFHIRIEEEGLGVSPSRTEEDGEIGGNSRGLSREKGKIYIDLERLQRRSHAGGGGR